MSLKSSLWERFYKIVSYHGPATSITWTRTMNTGLGPWTLDPDPKNLDPEKHGT